MKKKPEVQLTLDVNCGVEAKFKSGVTARFPGNFEPKEDGRIQVLSSGAGTQSTCMIVLAYMGIIPKPDIIITANTEREFSGVWPYLKKYVMPLVEEMGIPYLIPKKSEFTDWDICSPTDDETTLPPYFTEINGRDKNGKPNKQPGFCSSKWKVNVVQRCLNKHFDSKNSRTIKFSTWIGITLDEKRRAKFPDGKWTKAYPLLELGLTRDDAINVVKEFGLPEPPRSACWMCPNRSAKEWLYLKQVAPDDFEKAVQHEKELQKDFEWLWLTRLGVPLDSIDLEQWSKDEEENARFDKNCDSGMCFI